MNEANLHFKIKEYLIRLETKKDMINGLKIELENLNIKNKELIQNKDKSTEDFKKSEKNNKHLLNLSILSDKLNSNNSNYLKNIKNKKRNNSAAIIKRRINVDSILELKKKNEELNQLLLSYKNELNNIINQVNEKESNCRLLMINADNNTNFYSAK